MASTSPASGVRHETQTGIDSLEADCSSSLQAATIGQTCCAGLKMLLRLALINSSDPFYARQAQPCHRLASPDSPLSSNGASYGAENSSRQPQAACLRSCALNPKRHIPLQAMAVDCFFVFTKACHSMRCSWSSLWASLLAFRPSHKAMFSHFCLELEISHNTCRPFDKRRIWCESSPPGLFCGQLTANLSHPTCISLSSWGALLYTTSVFGNLGVLQSLFSSPPDIHVLSRLESCYHCLFPAIRNSANPSPSPWSSV